MYYVMVLQDGVPVRHGRMFKPSKLNPKSIPQPAVNLARRVNGYVEKYGRGVVWTPKVDLGQVN